MALVEPWDLALWEVATDTRVDESVAWTSASAEVTKTGKASSAELNALDGYEKDWLVS